MSATLAAELVALARERGIHLWSDAGTLRFRAPAGSLTVDLRERLIAHRHDVLALLERETARPDLRVIHGGLHIRPRCPRCGESDYLPIGGGRRRCWVCEARWGEGSDPGDPPELPHVARLLGQPVAAGVPPKRAPGWSAGAVLACPACGNRVYSIPPARRPFRRCDGPRGCGNTCNPEETT